MSLAASLLLCACDDGFKEHEGLASGTETYGAGSNPEAVFAIGDTGTVGLISSKAKRFEQLSVVNGRIKHGVEHDYSAFGPEDEITNGTAIDKDFVALTRTILVQNDKGELTDCRGQLIIQSIYGTEQLKLEVGPMPDAVGVSPDKKWLITADELDRQWGKCEKIDKNPGLSIISLADGPLNAKVVKTLQFKDLDTREPEGVAFASDSDTVIVTLQDSHEIAVFSLKAILAVEGDASDSDVKIIRLPQNAAKQDPWPDGIVSFDVGQKSYFAIAGEWNDTIIIVDSEGKVVSNTEVSSKDVPPNFPCNKKANEPLYSPDTVAAFSQGDRHFIAVSLRFAGAVIIYDVSTPATPKFVRIFKVGEKAEGACGKGASKVMPEGIAVSGNILWTANEDEPSITFIELPQF